MRPIAPVGLGQRWGIILAGGEGTRLQRLTRLVSGDDRPKQFCALLGGRTLLEQTRIRAESSIGRDQILVPLTSAHAEFYLGELGIRRSQRIVQPANRGTAPPIVYSLLSIEQNDSGAVVAVLPSDHYYTDDHGFAAALESAFDIASANQESVVLMGAPPRGPETEYGWIEPGSPMYGDKTDVASFSVRGFCEKPSFEIASRLLRQGGLWNTFVMVGHVSGFLDMVRAACPGLLDEFNGHRLWKGTEAHIQSSLYDRIESIDFSRDILSTQAERLVAMRLDFVGWSDLGHPERVIEVLRSTGFKPWWMKEWQALGRCTGGRDPLAEAALA